MRKYAVTVLPSIGSLKAREVPTRTEAPQPYLGFGDPIFSNRPAGLREVASTGVSYRGAFRGARADIDKLSKALPPLPATADELRAVARLLGVSQSQIKLGKDATVSAVKTTKLDDFGILHFATHALVAGETAQVSEQAEPALALTLPQVPSDFDDGLLRSSEVATLKLNADWVILSACNTAAGDKPGAEALSGLARAFFYAGAKTLLVSHWPVESEAAVYLTTRTIETLQKDATVSPAEGLRRAMIALMDDQSDPDNANPGIWAPFVIVGTTFRPGT
jgi:CHAT domain-containing protein